MRIPPGLSLSPGSSAGQKREIEKGQPAAPQVLNSESLELLFTSRLYFMFLTLIFTVLYPVTFKRNLKLYGFYRAKDFYPHLLTSKP